MITIKSDGNVRRSKENSPCWKNPWPGGGRPGSGHRADDPGRAVAKPDRRDPGRDQAARAVKARRIGKPACSQPGKRALTAPDGHPAIHPACDRRPPPREGWRQGLGCGSLGTTPSRLSDLDDERKKSPVHDRFCRSKTPTLSIYDTQIGPIKRVPVLPWQNFA